MRNITLGMHSQHEACNYAYVYIYANASMNSFHLVSFLFITFHSSHCF